MSGRAKWLLRLYRRMMAYSALPYAGGLLDQDEETMRLIDVVHEEMGAVTATGSSGDGSGAPRPGSGGVIKAFGTFEHMKGR